MLNAKLVLLFSLSSVGCAHRADKVLAPQASRVTSKEALLVFLQNQGGAFADLACADLERVTSVRLDQDYETEELALLAGLPALREVIIWRDGEARIGQEGRPAPTDSDLERLASLSSLEIIRIGGWNAPFTDEGVSQLVELPKLRDLQLIQAQGISDDAMESVARMSALESLNITYTNISDKGLANLLASKSLHRVRYGWAAKSRRWLASFLEAHPEPSFRVD